MSRSQGTGEMNGDIEGRVQVELPVESFCRTGKESGGREEKLR
jgi:hypothetical protein